MFQHRTDELHLREYVYIIRKWKWMILVFCVIFGGAAIYKESRNVPVYQATARLVVDARIPKADPFQEDYYWERRMADEELKTQHMLLKSRDLAERVADRLDLFDEAASTLAEADDEPEPATFAWQSALTVIPSLFGSRPQDDGESETEPQTEDMLIESIQHRIIVNPIPDSYMVDVSIVSPDPDEAATLVNTVAEEFVAQDLEVKNASSRDAVQWLVDEVEDARQRVTASEAALQAYKEAHGLLSMDDHQRIVMDRLSQLSNAVNQAKIERIEFEAQRRELQRYSKAELETFSLVVSNTTIHWLKVDLARLEEELAEAKGTFREKHPEVTSLQAQIDAMQSRIDQEVAKILTSFSRDYEMAVVKERDLIEAFEQQKHEAFELNQKAVTYNVLANELESNRWVYNSLLQQMKEMSIHERLEASNIRIVDLAQVPRAPINSKTQRTLMMALLLGLASGVGLAFFVEYLDNSIKTPDDVKQYAQIPFLGVIPKMAAKALRDTAPEQIVALAPKSVVSEAYRSLRTSVSISAMPDDTTAAARTGTTLLITSAEPSEGKSCTVANLATAMAQSGRKTLVVDCDFRRPQVHKIFHVENKNGFADVLSRFAMRGTISLKRTSIPNLDVLPCGTIPPNPSELLESPAMKKIIDALATKYDTVLLDSPPVNSVTDPIILSRLADGAVLVIRAGETKRDIVQRAAEQLTSAGANVLGGVINSVDIKKNKYYYYYAYHYSHYYGKDDVAVAIA